MPETNLIIFDWDGTIANGAIDAYHDCYHEAAKGVGVKLSFEEERGIIDGMLGATDINILKKLIGENGEKLAKAKELYDEHYRRNFVRAVEAVPGSPEMLEKLAGKYTLALATGVNPESLRDEIMPKFGIKPEWFKAIITTYDSDGSVPADGAQTGPKLHFAETILQETGMSPSQAIVVGDSEIDVNMAREASIEPIVVLTGLLIKSRALQMGIRHIISDVTELIPVLEQIRAA